MTKEEILTRVDHTLLTQTATSQEIKTLCDDAIFYKTASVCIPPAFVDFAAQYLQGRLPVCTVIGFPNGYQTRHVKEVETKEALQQGAGEIDMVIHIGDVKEAAYDRILDEISSLKDICGEKILKVIIETCFLTDDEKKKMCEVVTDAGADFIKTSTGFGGTGATYDDVALMRRYVGKEIKIKAAGGIHSFQEAERFITLGADRLGTSRLVQLLKEK